MSFFSRRVHENIVDEDHHEFIEIRFKDSIHEIHKGYGGIGKAKGHYQKFKVPITSTKSCFGDIFLPDTELMISRLQIDFREKF